MEISGLASIIIPTYKRFEFFYDALDSVLAQNYDKIEIVICDDCSQNFDEPAILGYIEKNKKANIRNVLVLQNDSNLGTVKNLNKAIGLASGEYILELSSDDCFYDEKVVSNVVKALKISSTGIIACKRAVVDAKGNIVRYMPSDKACKRILKMDREAQHIAFVTGEFYEMASGSATYFTKKFFNKHGGYDERYRLLEDWPFFLKVTRETSILCRYDILSIKYRVGGISSNNNPIIVNDYVSMLKNETDLECFLVLPIHVRRYARFNIMRFEGRKVLAYLLYFDILVRRFFYALNMKRYRSSNN